MRVMLFCLVTPSLIQPGFMLPLFGSHRRILVDWLVDVQGTCGRVLCACAGSYRCLPRVVHFSEILAASTRNFLQILAAPKNLEILAAVPQPQISTPAEPSRKDFSGGSW